MFRRPDAGKFDSLDACRCGTRPGIGFRWTPSKDVEINALRHEAVLRRRSFGPGFGRPILNTRSRSSLVSRTASASREPGSSATKGPPPMGSCVFDDASSFLTEGFVGSCRFSQRVRGWLVARVCSRMGRGERKRKHAGHIVRGLFAGDTRRPPSETRDEIPLSRSKCHSTMSLTPFSWDESTDLLRNTPEIRELAGRQGFEPR